MTLSERERRELAALEQRFAREDPALERRLRRGRLEPVWMPVLLVLLMVITVCGGLTLIVLGAAEKALLLTGVGIPLMVIGPAVVSLWLRMRRKPGRGS